MPTLSVFVEESVRDFLASSDNNLGPGTSEKAWDDFLLGYSSGDDELYSFWKEHIGEFHWTPAEAFEVGMSPEGLTSGAAAAPTSDRSFAGADNGGPLEAPRPEELTVVSWALSHTEATKAANREQSEWPSEPWARTRMFGQSGNRTLHRSVVAALAAHGYPAVAPGLLPQHRESESESQGRASNWSERHIAYAAGLGTFGLCGGLITPLGKAVRLGSVVVRANIPPTPRPYSGAYDYCLHFKDGACRACVDRCPVGSVREEGRDKSACAHRLEMATAEFVEREYGFKGYGCGLCQTGVPCESAIPVSPPE
jgi:epoxyqueuosine reductase